MLGVLTLGAAAVTAGVLVAVRFAGDSTAPSWVTILASTTLVLGLGLLVGTFLGRARWLVIPGIVLLLATASAGVVDRFDGPTGTRTLTPQTLAEVPATYTWGAGELVVDLTEVAGAPDLSLSLDLGVGSLRVIVPDDATLIGSADVRLGSIRTPDGTEYDGFDSSADLGADSSARPSPGTGDDQMITLDLEVGLGEVVVSRA